MSSACLTASPRQRVLDALSHRTPARVPFSWQFGLTGEMSACFAEYLRPQGLDWVKLRTVTDDIVAIAPPYAGPAMKPGHDQWGVVREKRNYGRGEYSEISVYPLAGLEDSSRLRDYPWPQAADFDHSALAVQLARLDPARPQAVKYSAGNPLEIFCWMIGLEEAMILLVSEPELAHEALTRITDFFAAKLAQTCAAVGPALDIVFFADDLGSQTGPLISPQTYREVIRPHHERLFGLARRLAPQARIMMHSDGSVFALLPDLIHAGLEVLEAVQVDCRDMEPEKLKAAYGDRLAFHGAISVQQLLPRATPAQVEAECRRLVDILGAGGGYVAAPSHAVQIGTPPENILAMLRGVLGPEDYAQALNETRI